MKTTRLLLWQSLFLLVVVGTSLPSFCQERTWHDDSGKFDVQAEYLGTLDDLVVLKKHNGNIIRVPISKLSLADREYLKHLTPPSTPASGPTNDPKTNEGPATSSDSSPAEPRAESADSASLILTGDSTEADSGLESASRDSAKAPPIEVPVINVSEEQIAALPGPLRSIANVLNSGSDSAAIRSALTELADNWPEANATVLDLVRKTTANDEKFCRMKALMLLCEHDFSSSFPFILARVDDPSFEVRWSALEYIERSGDRRAMKPLVDRFIGKDRAKISLALMNYGSQVEPYLFEYLKHSRADVRMETSLLLGKLGSEASIPKLEEVAANDTNPVVALQAKSAIRTINERLADSRK
jgi:hypothetical protein